MKILRNIALLTSSFLVGSVGYAVESFETKAPLHLIDPDAYSDLQLRFYSNNYEKGKTDDSYFTQGKRQVRLSVGSKYFDDRLDIKAVVAGNVYNDSTQVVDRGTSIASRFDLWANDFISITPVLSVNLPHKDFYSQEDLQTRISIGTEATVDHEVSTSYGAFNFLASTDIAGYYYTTPNKTNVYDESGEKIKEDAIEKDVRDRFSLRSSQDSKELTTDERSPTLKNNFFANASYKPSFVDDIKVSVSYLRIHKLSPVVQLSKDNKNLEVRSTSSGIPDYKVSSFNLGIFNVSYGINDTLTLKNETSIAEKAPAGKTYPVENMTSLTMELL